MNNLLVALLFLAVSGAVWLSQHAAFSQARRTAQALVREVDQARAGLQALSQQAAQAQSRLTQCREDIAGAREELARVAQAAQAIDFPPLDPAAEGAWPGTKPYFYLLKKRLREVGYIPMTNDGHLGEDAAILFGMSPAERATVDNSLQRFREAVQQLQAGFAQALPAEASQNTDTHRELTYEVPALTNEFSELELQCEASLTTTLGQNRAGLFLQQLRPLLEQTWGRDGNKAYTVSLTADRDAAGGVRHQIVISPDHGGSKFFYSVDFPLTPGSALWNYRHLFGQEPLLAESGKP